MKLKEEKRGVVFFVIRRALAAMVACPQVSSQ